MKQTSEQNLKRQLCNKLIQEGKVKAYDVIRHSYTHNRLDNGDKNMGRTESEGNISPTLDTRCDCLGVVEPIACEIRADEGIRTFSDNMMGTLRTIDSCGCKGIIEPIQDGMLKTKNKKVKELINNNKLKDGMFLDFYNQSTNEEISGTITTRVDASNGTGVVEKYELSDNMKRYIVSQNDKYKVNPNNLVINRYVACTKSTREGCSRADSSDYISPDFGENQKLEPNQDLLKYRIRKLTPKECFRLMGVHDRDCDNIAENQTNASLYHLAGDSIVVNVLMAIFNQML